MILEKKINSEKGVVLIWTVIMISVMLVVVSSLVLLVIADSKRARKINYSAQAYLAAEAGMERALNYAENDTDIAALLSVENNNNPLYETANDSYNENYGFQIVESFNGETPIPKFDNNLRDCMSGANERVYCFVATGEANSHVRKLEGRVTAIDEDQSRVIHPIDKVAGNNNCSFNMVKLINIASYFPLKTLPAGQNFKYQGFIDGLNDIKTDEKYQLGLFEGGSLGTCNRFGLGIEVVRNAPNNYTFSMGRSEIDDDIGIDNHTTGTLDINKPLEPARTDGKPGDFRFELIYREGFMNSTLTLKIKEIIRNSAMQTGIIQEDGRCLGIATINIENLTNKPALAYFDAANDVDPDTDTDDMINLYSVNDDTSPPIKISNLFYQVW